ncbi:MAG: ATP-binding protein, partial [Minisyncoccia bacterium]
SLAIIHDVVGSLAPKGLKPKTDLRLMKGASLMIALSAVLVSHLFSSVMDIVFILMVIGNSIFFPGLLWGIMGVKASKTGFWVGVVSGALTVAVCTLGFELFPLYTMLIAISINSAIILVDALLEKPVQSAPFSFFLPKDKKSVLMNVRRNAFFGNSVRNQEYCTIFFICAIAVSLFPFFFSSVYGLASFDPTILITGVLVAAISLAMLFREVWWDYVDKIFPLVWLLSLTLAFPLQSFYMLIKSQLSLVWLADCLIIIPLMFLLTTKAALFASLSLGLIASFALSRLNGIPAAPDVALNFGYWALVIHFSVLAICLALFRKRDLEHFVLKSSTLAHEVSRSFLAFETAACYLNKYLPEVIATYRQNGTKQEVSDLALDELLTLPTQLEQAAKRSRNIVEKLSFYSISSRAHFENFDIMTSIKDAINDPSIKTKLTDKLAVVIDLHSFVVHGDLNQMTQVMINILENALHATTSKAGSTIQIIVDRYCVLIRDTGEGIDKFNLPNIFDERFSTKSTSGQGLFFCKGIMKNHGGSISCSSLKGEFTEMRLNFPVLHQADKPNV